MKNRSMNTARFALTGVALAAACLWSTQAWALGLGRLTVQSALGEALRAEIEVTSLSAEEAESLQLRVATPDAYRAAGVEYNAVLPCHRECGWDDAEKNRIMGYYYQHRGELPNAKAHVPTGAERREVT